MSLIRVPYRVGDETETEWTHRTVVLKSGLGANKAELVAGWVDNHRTKIKPVLKGHLRRHLVSGLGARQRCAQLCRPTIPMLQEQVDLGL